MGSTIYLLGVCLINNAHSNIRHYQDDDIADTAKCNLHNRDLHDHLINNCSINWRSVVYTLLLPSLLLLQSCSTISVNKQSTSQIISVQRGSIVTQNTLSTQTTSSLISYGIEDRACLINFDTCLEQIEKATLLKPKREVFALLAELYYAKAQQINNAGTCQTSLQRPPINSYYPNAYSFEGFTAQKELIDKGCQNTYLSYLVSSIRFSYAYLFFDSLENDFTEDISDGSSINVIANDLVIQTKDIYNVASSQLIKTLYNAQAEDFAKLDTVKLQTTKLDDTHNKQSSVNNNVTSIISDLQDNDKAKEVTSNSQLLDIDPKHNNQIEILRVSLPHTFFGNINSNKNHIDSTNNHSDNVQMDDDASSKDDMPSSSSVKPIPTISPTSRTSLSIYLPNETDYLYALPTPYSEASGLIEPNTTNKTDLYSSYDLNYSGLKSVSKREGLGVSFVTLLSNRQTTSITHFILSKSNSLNSEQATDRIHRTGNLLLTGIVIPKGDSITAVLNGSDVDVRLYNPRHVSRVNILGQPYTLKANFSASYGLWLSENSLSSLGYLNLLSQQQTMVRPQLFLLEPYDPNKRVIIMVHGLASSPATWVGITNDIFNDDKLRESYQVWQVFYPTQIPMLENRYQIQTLLDTAFNEVDPDGNDVASQHSVIISHSMGTVISRMMLSNDNLNEKLSSLKSDSENVQLSGLIRQSYIDHNIDDKLELNRLKQVDKAIFISAPFRGTDFADRWFTRALRRIVQLPLGFVQTVTGNLSSIAAKGELTANPLGALYLQNGASQLSDQSSFMQLTQGITIDAGVTYHSIIASNDQDITQGLARLANTDAKADLSEYHSGLEVYDDPYRPTKIPLADINVDKDAFDRLNNHLDNSVNTDISPQKTDHNNTRIATVTVDGQLDPDIAKEISDGIVPYTSAHLAGAKSETIISGGHGIQESPQAILLLRNILREHLTEHPLPQRTASIGDNSVDD